MAQHARFSPSKLDGLSKCVRFLHVPMESAATEGTDLHSAFETGSQEGINEEQQRVVTQALEYIDGLKVGQDWVELREVRVELHDLTYGTADRVLIRADGREAHVVDFKSVRTENDYEFQVQTYGAAVLEAYPAVEKLSTHVLAPRLGTGALVQQYDRSLLLIVRQKIEELYARIDDPWVPPTPHPDLCHICARASRCPALNPVITTVATAMALPLPQEYRPNMLATDDDRARAQALASLLITWGEQVKAANADYMKSQGLQSLAGVYKLVERSTGVRIPREATGACWVLLRDSGVASETGLVSAMTLSLSELSEVMATTKAESKASIKAKLVEMLKDYCQEGRTAYLQKSRKQDDVMVLEGLQ